MLFRLKNYRFVTLNHVLLFAKAHKEMESKKRKNTGGRPQKEELIKQKYQAKCYLDYFENEKLKSYKEKHSFKTSEIVKTALLEHLKLAPKKSNNLPKETLELFAELRRTNQLLNQVARHLNIGLPLSSMQTLDFFKNLSNIKNNSKEIINTLKQ